MTDRTLRTAMLVLAGIGLAISAYLTYVHYGNATIACTGISNCEKVQESDFATPAGIPVALIGLLGYVAILASLFVANPNAGLATAYLALVGFGYSAYLTYVEAVRVEAWCQWCVVSAILMTALAVLASLRVLRAARELAATTA